VNLPKLVCRVGGTDTEIKSKLLAVQTGIIAELDYTYFPLCLDINFKLIGYSVLVIQKDSCRLLGDFKGNRFSDGVKKKFSKLNKDDKVIFYNMQAIRPDGIVEKIKAVELKIIE
jgi:hypothetical protein